MASLEQSIILIAIGIAFILIAKRVNIDSTVNALLDVVGIILVVVGVIFLLIALLGYGLLILPPLLV